MIASALVILLTSGEGITGTLLLCAGIAFLATGILRHRKYGDDPESDERSRKIGAYGLSYAWLTGLLVIFGLFWLDELGLLMISARNALAVSILALTFSAVFFQMCLFRKGDIG